MDFVKMEGLGNDFVVIAGPRDLDAGTVAALCDRRRGIGADGVLVVSPGPPIRMEYWNADGSPAEMCGNGLRCVARFVSERGWVDEPVFSVLTPAGERSVEVGDDVVRVELGPVDADGSSVDIAGYELTRVGVGNPHAVTFVSDCYATPVSAVGPVVEGDPAFPGRTNVEFATVVSRNRLALRVWERGVGETLACGTGAAAAVAEAHRRGLTDNRVSVLLPGGELVVEIVEGVAWIEGPARSSFVGTV
jgi:diaminopimelate epimerase